MSGQTTVIAIGGVTVYGSALTGALARDVENYLSNPPAPLNVVTIPPNGSIPAPIAGDVNVLVLPPGETGVVGARGYQVIVNASPNDTVLGLDHQIVVGDLNMTGFAGTVVAGATVVGSFGTQLGGGTGTVTDMTPDAELGFLAGFNLVYGLASGQSFRFDNGLNRLSATGMGDVVSVDGAASVVSYMDYGGTFYQWDSASQTVVAGSGGLQSAFYMWSGNSVIWGGPDGASVYAGSGNTEFYNTGGISTVLGSSGADTVLAGGGGVLYAGGAGKSVFIGGDGFSTVYAASNEVAYGGSGGEQIILSQGDTLLFLGGAGKDSIIGGSNSVAPTVWGNNGNDLTVYSSTPGALYVLYGANDTMNLSWAGGSAHIVAMNGGPFAGNDSLVMASAGNDSLVMFAGAEFGLQTGPHTITVANWQSSDVLDLSDGYTSADAAGAQKALAGGASSFTLADGTTVQFTGSKPGGIVHI